MVLPLVITKYVVFSKAIGAALGGAAGGETQARGGAADADALGEVGVVGREASGGQGCRELCADAFDLAEKKGVVTT